MISPNSMLSELRSHNITNPKALRTLLERHRRELGGAVSEVKREAIIHQHEVEMRLFLIDELLASQEPDSGPTTSSRYEMLQKLTKASATLQHARRLCDELGSLVDDLRVGHDMLNNLVQLGAVSQTMVRSGNPSFGKRLSLVRESLEQIEKNLEKQWVEDLENGQANVREGLEGLYKLLAQVTETGGSEEQAALLPKLKEQLDALMTSIGAFLAASPEPAEMLPAEEAPAEAPPADEPPAPAEEAPAEAPPADEPPAPAEEAPAEAPPVDEPLAEAPAPDAAT